MRTYNGTYDVYGNGPQNQTAPFVYEDLTRKYVKLGERTAIEDEEEKEEKKQENMASKGMDAYNKYKKYSKQFSSQPAADGGESGYIDTMYGETGSEEFLGGEAAEPAAMAEEGATGAEGAAGGESGGMGSLGAVLAIIYGADQAKKKWGGYDETGGETKLGADSHYYKTDVQETEIPWDEKTTQQKTVDAPAGLGSVGGDPVLHIAGLTSDSDTGIGKYYKEMARIEKQVFEPISKIISWLGIDL